MTADVPGVVSVARDNKHRFSKPRVDQISLLAGIGVDGDAHAGVTVQHRYLKRKDPTAANLTQVHLIAAELFTELAADGYTVGPGDLGENITTRGIDLIALPEGTRLHLGASAVVEITGLRSPCSLINKFQAGLMKACISRDPSGRVIRKAGIMGIVLTGGLLQAEDTIRIELPTGPHLPLGVV